MNVTPNTDTTLSPRLGTVIVMDIDGVTELTTTWCRMWNEDAALAHQLMTDDCVQWWSGGPDLDAVVGPAAQEAFVRTAQTQIGNVFRPRLYVADDDMFAYVLLSGPNNDSTMSGSMRDLRRARSLAGNGTWPVLYMRRDEQEYLIRDAATLKSFESAFAPVKAIGEKQSEIGEKLGELGGKQGEVGGRLGELGGKMGELGGKQGELGSKIGEIAQKEAELSRAQDRYEQEHGKESPEIARQLEQLEREEEALDKQMDEIGPQLQPARLAFAGQPEVGAADRLDAGAHGGLVELHQRAHVAHVGDRHGRHTGSRHGLDQGFDPHQPVDQGELGVQAQMDEAGGHGNPVGDTETIRPGLYRAST